MVTLFNDWIINPQTEAYKIKSQQITLTMCIALAENAHNDILLAGLALEQTEKNEFNVITYIIEINKIGTTLFHALSKYSNKKKSKK